MNETPVHDMAPQEPGRLARLAAVVMRAAVWSQNQQGEQSPLDPLDAELAALDGSIPQYVDDFAPDTGRRYEREKTFEPAVTRTAMDEVFGAEFSEHEPALKTASTELFAKLRVANLRDTAPLGRIDGFLAGFPRNISDRLGEEASGEALLAVLKTGTAIINASESKSGTADMLASDKGTAVMLLGNQIPQLIKKQGIGCLLEIETVAQGQGVSSAQKYTDFLLKQEAGAATQGFTAQDKLGVKAPDSPFAKEDKTRAWQGGRSIETEQRAPVWADLAEMAGIGDRWAQEYGLVIQRQIDGSTSLDYIRGSDASTYNKSQLAATDSEQRVFFHSHPKHDTGGQYGPLVSGADVHGTFFNDYGGGYLNVVCADGVTLCVDATSMDESDANGWRIESGELQGTRFGEEGDIKTMSQLQATGEPYAYSIASGSAGKKLTFVHIPWSKLPTDKSLEDICFGDGLQDMLPASLTAGKGAEGSLHATLVKAKTRSHV